MYRAPSYDLNGLRTESILIYGVGATPVAMLAMGLAQRVRATFAWANCAPPSPDVQARVRRRLGDHDVGGPGGVISASELELQRFRVEAFNALVGTGTDRNLLIGLLHLPSFLQALVGYPPQNGHHPALVLSRVDALPEALLKDTLSNAQFHETVHRAQLTLVATHHGVPAPFLQRQFDRIFGVEEMPGAQWAEALVWSERGLVEVDLLQPQPLRTAWTRLELDPALLTK